jgi:hypothetical protein
LDSKEKTDFDVWDQLDAGIIRKFNLPSSSSSFNNLDLGDSHARWKSKIYDHYEVSLERHLRGDGSPDYITYIFTCRVDPTSHHHKRKWMQNGQGTKNLKQG